MPTMPSQKRCARRIRRAIALGGCALTAAAATADLAHAEWYFSKSRAASAARDFVADRYADTYTWDLTASCRPHFGAYDPRYRYHTWDCRWYDSSDGTAGVVRIVGRPGRGFYAGRVIRPAYVTRAGL